MTPAQRVHLDRIIADERAAELRPHGEEPWTLTSRFTEWQPRAVTIDVRGEVRPPVLLDEVDWHDVAAIRLDFDIGPQRDTVALLSDDADEWDEYGEPAPVAPVAPPAMEEDINA